jgi:hypothetical protein
MICGKQPPAISDTDYKKSGHVYYSPKSASGKCCNKAKRTVEKGAQLTTADSTGHTWCKNPSALGAARSLMGVESAAKVGGGTDFGGKEENENGWVPESWFQGVINGRDKVKNAPLPCHPQTSEPSISESTCMT